MSELTRLVLYHFSDELERAIRAAYEELFGRPLPAKFIIALGSPAHPHQGRSRQLPSQKRRTAGRRRKGGVGQGGPSRGGKRNGEQAEAYEPPGLNSHRTGAVLFR